ncbi:hypothetical protein M406DRAFT_348789 [Cryphonectria parasitica EP155]|uniref:Ankyrin repeat protein n=1 Tax=Cryphonectria parasitica (strain ATCC 38755 / EP155) TaxID=660469 RepID=A0A9P5CTE8_CRYP1|nr:uncharacterized protein M406DRAFT_348789 [Cryphonectria parasitica EP155]KAF3769592.1 hypothetical protein M406DRAFT_348789 [Cryphonectria parasitica EP155]
MTTTASLSSSNAPEHVQKHVKLISATLSGNESRVREVLSQEKWASPADHDTLKQALGYLDILRQLLEAGADVHPRKDKDVAPLFKAAEAGHLAIVKELLDHKADPNWRLPKTGQTALCVSALRGHTTIVKILLDARAHPDGGRNKDGKAGAEDGRTPLLLLASEKASKLSEPAREASKRFEATIVDFGEFQEEKFLKDTVKEKKPQLVFKHTVYDLLYGWDEKTGKATVPVLTKNIKWQPHFRWIHLPANNIAWIDTLLAKSFIEGGHRDVEGFKALGKCFDQEHRGPLAHANFMRHYCERIPSRRADREESLLGSVAEQPREENGGPSQNTGAESVSTEHSENSTAKPDTKKKSKSEKIAERHPQRQKRNKGNPGNPPGSKDAKLASSSRQSSWASSEAFRQLVNNGKMVLFMPFLHYETHNRRLNMTATIARAQKGEPPPDNASRDELLIHAYMEQYLHPRRTLDQFFYHGIDTTQRDSDQVVWRYCQKHREPEEPKLFMVDQLWMWILGGDTVITCFPQRWDQPKQDPLNVVDGIIEETNAKTRGQIQSVYDLAMVITNRCAGMFDRHRIDEQQFQFLDMFESSIGNVTNEESKLFNKFNRASEKSTQWLKKRHRHDSDGQDEDEFADDLLNIHSETKFLAEIKDIQDELNIIAVVLHVQVSVLKKLQLNIEQELRVEGSSRRTTDLILRDIKHRFQEQMRLIEERYDDVERMNDQARGISASLTNLLDLKQKHSNALEARFAREQAIIAAKQGQTIMVFTIVTIIFLPMSFIAAFFAINLEDWGDRLTIGYVSKYMFGIGLAVSFIFVAAAFLVHDISNAWKSIVRGTKSYLNYTRDKSKSVRSQVGQSEGVSHPWPSTDHEKPTTAGGASTAYRSMADDMEWKRRGLDGPDMYMRMSLEREQRDHPRLGLSPLRFLYPKAPSFMILLHGMGDAQPTREKSLLLQQIEGAHDQGLTPVLMEAREKEVMDEIGKLIDQKLYLALARVIPNEPNAAAIVDDPEIQEQSRNLKAAVAAVIDRHEAIISTIARSKKERDGDKPV